MAIKPRYKMECIYRIIDTETYGAERVVIDAEYSKDNAELLCGRLNKAHEVGVEAGVESGKREAREEARAQKIAASSASGMTI